ncbi:MAG: tyrosine-type recombinase/integrase [Lachnospiraceae bacterium]|nr:tyrosine-type recombinase/integrase [Lachnospiraceae bacterium]
MLNQYAKLNEYIDRDFTEGLVYEWTESSTQIHDRYSDEEIRIPWSKLYEINNVDIILIMIYTGLRPTELLEILTENVHLEEKYMTGGMKTDAGGDRIIPLNDKIIPLVKNRYDPSKKYLINNKYVNHYAYGTYANGNFNTCMGKLKMMQFPHDDRHTFASLMDNAGANDVCIKLIMGHSMKDDITKETFTHKTIKELLTEVNKI